VASYENHTSPVTKVAPSPPAAETVHYGHSLPMILAAAGCLTAVVLTFTAIGTGARATA
jgi:hypothetical protein